MCSRLRIVSAGVAAAAVVFLHIAPLEARSPAHEAGDRQNSQKSQNSGVVDQNSGAIDDVERDAADAAPPKLQRAIPIGEMVRKLAREASEKPYQPPEAAQRPEIAITYDDYRKIRFRSEKARWRGQPHGFELHGLPMGWLFEHPISLSTVRRGTESPEAFTLGDFEHVGSKAEQVDDTVEIPISGFRINGRLNSVDQSDEIIVFQGASYFRALARNQLYGLSARGLAIATASQSGEEFPAFRKFWIEEPEANSANFRIYALLDSESTTGAYELVVTPGNETVVDVRATLFPRTVVEDVGLAPLTSMHLTGPVTPGRVRDFRPRVHDSQGLAIRSANGERVWRPLANPTALQVSTFEGNAPKGFGLIQRVRKFEAYEDLEARYEKRPSAWIEPTGELFNSGSVVLVEIPAEEEVHDNIVAFWRPTEKLVPGKSYDVNYTIRWRNDVPDKFDAIWVKETRIGRAYHVDDEAVRFVVDYETHPAIAADIELANPTVSASQGKISGVGIQPNPETGGVRATFRLHTQGIDWSELRMTLPDIDGKQSETWLFRWTRGR